jgi:hypothetical protein
VLLFFQNTHISTRGCIYINARLHRRRHSSHTTALLPLLHHCSLQPRLPLPERDNMHAGTTRTAHKDASNHRQLPRTSRKQHHEKSAAAAAACRYVPLCVTRPRRVACGVQWRRGWVCVLVWCEEHSTTPANGRPVRYASKSRPMPP